jgi:hypothetical protein
VPEGVYHSFYGGAYGAGTSMTMAEPIPPPAHIAATTDAAAAPPQLVHQRDHHRAPVAATG